MLSKFEQVMAPIMTGFFAAVFTALAIIVVICEINFSNWAPLWASWLVMILDACVSIYVGIRVGIAAHKEIQEKGYL